jgi:RNA polymerase sigma factor (sigma-70 family)
MTETLQHKINYASDEEIVEKILGGESMLFEVLIRRYNSMLYKIARTYGFNHHDAEDLMQESHYSAFRYLKSFRKQASYKTWLTKIHLNHCFHKRNDGHASQIERSNEIESEEFFLGEAKSGNYDAENRVLNKELGRVLEISLEQIPLAYRSVFVLREN